MQCNLFKIIEIECRNKKKNIFHQKLSKNYICRDTQLVIDISGYIIVDSSAPMKNITECRI